jgi:hypothetical protein
MQAIRQKFVEWEGRHAVLYWLKRGPTGEEEMRLAWPDGAVIADDLVRFPDNFDPEEWFDRLEPRDMPFFSAKDGQTEKRYRVRIAELEDRVARLEALLAKKSPQPVKAEG